MSVLAAPLLRLNVNQIPEPSTLIQKITSGILKLVPWHRHITFDQFPVSLCISKWS